MSLSRPACCHALCVALGQYHALSGLCACALGCCEDEGASDTAIRSSQTRLPPHLAQCSPQKQGLQKRKLRHGEGKGIVQSLAPEVLGGISSRRGVRVLTPSPGGPGHPRRAQPPHSPGGHIPTQAWEHWEGAGAVGWACWGAAPHLLQNAWIPAQGPSGASPQCRAVELRLLCGNESCGSPH